MEGLAGRTPGKPGLMVSTAVPWGGLAGHQAWLLCDGWTVTTLGCSLTHPSLWWSARVTQLIRGFGSSWKSSVESLSQDVMRSFTNFRNGTSIIQVTGHSQPFACVPWLSVSLLFPLGSASHERPEGQQALCLRLW